MKSGNPAPKERGILFAASMVLALLSGAKNATRRIVKPQPDDDGIVRELGDAFWQDTGRGRNTCPYGQAGDRLWVREPWGIDHVEMVRGIPKAPPTWLEEAGGVLYRADGDCCEQIPECQCNDSLPPLWRPSIHMPRWASRILLELTAVRVERLREISEQDAEAEGSPLADSPFGVYPSAIAARVKTYRAGFEQLWSEINGRESWDANPWVWVLSFRPVEVRR